MVFSELREDDIKWMFDFFMLNEVIVRGDMHVVFPFSGIWGIRMCAHIRV